MNCNSLEFFKLSSEILARGKKLRFQAQGGSMYPFIRDGDILEVEPVNGEEIRLGDIIFYRTASDRIAVHRVIKKFFTNGRLVLITKGDANAAGMEEVLFEEVLGRVKTVERKRRQKIKLDYGTGRLRSILYGKISPFLKGLKSRWQSIK